MGRTEQRARKYPADAYVDADAHVDTNAYVDIDVDVGADVGANAKEDAKADVCVDVVDVEEESGSDVDGVVVGDVSFDGDGDSDVDVDVRPCLFCFFSHC